MSRDDKKKTISCRAFLGSGAAGLLAAPLGVLGAQAFPDKGVIANDAVSGRQVVLAWDPATRTLGAVTGIVDPKTGAIIPIADAQAIKVAGLDEFNPNGTTTLQSFAPQGYFAVSLR